MFSQDVSNALFANGGNKGAAANFEALKTRTTGLFHEYQNDDQPLAEAQRISDSLMSMKQRRPMTLEWEQTKGYWTKTTFYINPQRLSIQTQKIKSKAITRGGIVYHHWGDDHWTMSLSGTTGLSGMTGILKLENAYRASGTLLKYGNYKLDEDGPDIEVGAYKAIDFNDAVSILEAASSTTNPTLLGKIRSENNAANGNLKKITDNLLKVLKTNLAAQNKSKKMDTINKQLNDYYEKSKKTRTPTASEFYNNALAIIRKNLGTSATSDVVVALAYQKTMDKYKNQTEDMTSLLYKASNQAHSGSAIEKAFDNSLQAALAANNMSYQDSIRATKDDLEARATFINEKRAEALRSHMSQIADWTQRELEIKNQLSGAVKGTGLFGDEWTPRRIVLYYENRAFIGHFDAFSYQRSADTPLIQYEMRFTVEKTIVGTML